MKIIFMTLIGTCVLVSSPLTLTTALTAIAFAVVGAILQGVLP